VIQRLQFRITGRVQGIGFRPLVWRLAERCGCSGWVLNDPAGVLIEIQGNAHQLSDFQTLLLRELPPLADINSISQRDCPIQPLETGFTICQSRSEDRSIAWISPDIGTCDDCLRELQDPADPRFAYPFLNCTNCGPRFTILQSLPYDRPRTTMDRFLMCEFCRSEYGEPANRRFHAQPIACPDCGPVVWLEPLSTVPQFQGAGSRLLCENDARPVDSDFPANQQALQEARRRILAGEVVAIKGIGGFHLACDAFRDSAVQRLRARKKRPQKPLAVMVADLATAATLAPINPAEAEWLQSAARPIVLLPRHPQTRLASSVAPDNPRLGVMLAYSGLHHLLIRPGECWVMTSGNRADEPICRLNSEARFRLSEIADAVLLHDRPIQAVCDDSVICGDGGNVLPIRRSRGYAPLPLPIPLGTGLQSGCCLGVGGEIKNTFCLSIDHQAIVSQHIGDLSNRETLAALDREVANLSNLYQVQPEIVAVDLHPGYLSSAWGARFADRLGIPLVKVQHHYAHLASLIVEHGIGPDQPVIGCLFDGTGYGTDGKIWGGEWLIGHLKGFQRFAHLDYTWLPAGDGPVRQPARTALAHLFHHRIPWNTDQAVVRFLDERALRNLQRQLQQNFQTVHSSSMGRLFDAVAALLDLCHQISFEGEAGIALETLASTVADPAEAKPYSFDLMDASEQGQPLRLSCRRMFREIMHDLQRQAPPALIAANFHQTVAEAALEICQLARARTGVNLVGLSGGVFQNVLLSNRLRSQLIQNDFQVLSHQRVPPNDGGLALGQVAIAQYQALGKTREE
jgi:hydrogenase maturation protein HypF